MDAAPTTRRRRSTLALRLALVALLAVPMMACGPASPTRVSIPPDATGSAVPAETGRPPTPSPAAPAASPSGAASAAAVFPITLTDDEGTALTLLAEPQRIVSLTPAATETLFAIGAGDRVVGKVEDIAAYPPEADTLPVVGSFAGVDIEQILALESDLVIAGGNDGTPDDVIERLRSLDVPVLVVYAASVDEVLGDIELIGTAVGEADTARDLTASMQADFDQVAAAVTGVDRPRVFYETGDTPAIYGVADESFPAGMLELAGADPITSGSSTDWAMSQERLVTADPEIILLGDAAYGVTAESVSARPGWSGLTAVREGRIRPIDDIVVTRPGPRLLEGLRALVAAIHPEVTLPSAPPVPAGG